MSQNTFIEHLRNTNILNEQNKLPHVLNSCDYTKYKKYSLVNTITNQKNRFSELCLQDKEYIFDMELNNSNCPTIQMCNNTNIRLNRKLNTSQLPAPTIHFNKIYTPVCCKLFENRKYKYELKSKFKDIR
jgi:hypothetical protein